MNAVAPALVKPKLRGVSHLVAFFVAMVGALVLTLTPSSPVLHVAGVVYGLSLIALFGASGLYHVPMWSPEARRRMRKVDHAGIFFLIAGTYTPLAAKESGGHWTLSLTIMWVCAASGIAMAMFWAGAPRAVKAIVYVALGLFCAPAILNLPPTIGWPRVAVLLAGAVIYIAGAAVYAKRWPNPKPTIFGYHEVFHVMVIAAAAAQYVVVLDIVRSAG